tara:strand:- start:821 stop:1318 length:498 start_codon:yes stop_codon:yes gene_type:complete
MASILNVDKIRATGSTTDGLIVNSSGQVAQPALPYAMVNATGAVVTPATTVTYDNVISSSGISWNTSNYTFTVPVTGIYCFNGALRVDANRSYVWWAVADNGGNVLQASKLVLAHGQNSNFTTCSGSCLQSLTAATTYKIIFSDDQASSLSISGGQTWMDVHLVG